MASEYAQFQISPLKDETRSRIGVYNEANM